MAGRREMMNFANSLMGVRAVPVLNPRKRNGGPVGFGSRPAFRAIPSARCPPNFLSRAFINFPRNLASTRRPIFPENEETPRARIGPLPISPSRPRNRLIFPSASDYASPFLLHPSLLCKYTGFIAFRPVQPFVPLRFYFISTTVLHPPPQGVS